MCVPNGGEAVTLHQTHPLVGRYASILRQCVLIYSGAFYYCAEYAELVVPPSYTSQINARLVGEEMKRGRLSLHRQIRTHSSKTSVLRDEDDTGGRDKQ